MKYARYILAIVMFGVVLFASDIDIDRLPIYSTHYIKDTNPHVDLSHALSRAKARDKYVLLIVGGDWCKWSGQLDNFLDDHPKISQKLYDSFEVVRVYYGNGISKEGKSLLAQFPTIAGTPHFFVLDSTAKLLKSYDTSSLERGYSYNKTKVLSWIESNKKINKSNKKDK